MTFMPTGFAVSERIRAIPSSKSWPCTYTSDIGCTMPIPPASDTAATSSGLLHGYIAPQIRGTWIPASRVSAVSGMGGRLRWPDEPANLGAGNHLVRHIHDIGGHRHGLLDARGCGTATFGGEGTAGLLQVLDAEVHDDAARTLIAWDFVRAPSIDPTRSSWLPVHTYLLGGVLRVFPARPDRGDSISRGLLGKNYLREHLAELGEHVRLHLGSRVRLPRSFRAEAGPVAKAAPV